MSVPAWLVEYPPCSGLFPLDHRHGPGCLPIVRRHLPDPPPGWRWGYGRSAPVWSFWLERVGGSPGRWYVVGLPVASTAGGLVVAMWSYCRGHGHAMGDLE